MIIYDANKENKVTTGSMTGYKDDFIKFITKRIKHNSKYFKLKDENLNELLLADSYTAKVKCHEDDEYSEEAGKENVKYKTLDKYYKAFDNRLKKVIIDLFVFGFNLLNFAYEKISIDFAENIVMNIAEKTGYIICFYDDFEFEDSEEDNNEEE